MKSDHRNLRLILFVLLSMSVMNMTVMAQNKTKQNRIQPEKAMTRKRDPEVTYRLMLDDGKEYFKINLSRSQLTTGNYSD